MTKTILAGLAILGLGLTTVAAPSASATPCGSKTSADNVVPVGSPAPKFGGAPDGMGGYAVLWGDNGYLEASGGASGGGIDGYGHQDGQGVYGHLMVDGGGNPSVCFGTTETGPLPLP